ncbi:MAG: cytochrome c [Bdellovibrionales bacterium]
MKFKLFFTIFLISCGPNHNGPFDTDGRLSDSPRREEPLPEIQFEEVYTQILKESCESCHTWVSSELMLLDAGIIVAGDLNSLLLTEVESGSMPQFAPRLTEEEIDLIRSYILGLQMVERIF